MAGVDRTRLEDQIADELFKRIEVLHEAALVTSSSEDRDTQHRVRARSARWAAAVEDGGGWPQVRAELIDVLFPSGVPAAGDGWWRTPLGNVLGAAVPSVDGDR